MLTRFGRIAHGFANLSVPGDVAGSSSTVPEDLVLRKGLIWFITDPMIDPALLEHLRIRFYRHASFDVVPCLVDILASEFRQDPSLAEQIHGVLVLNEMELDIVGTDELFVQQVRFSGVRTLFGASVSRLQRRQRGGSPDGAQSWSLYSSHWVLMAGDVVIASTRMLAQRIKPHTLSQVVSKGRSLASIAQHLARRSRATRQMRVPVLALRIGGFAPVPEIGAAGKPLVDPSTSSPSRRDRGVSPIVPATVIALIVLVLAIVLRSPQVSRGELRELLWLLLIPPITPTATRTPTLPTETAIPTPVYPAPRLESPLDGAVVSERSVTLRWTWEGRLRPDEYFDVRLGRAGRGMESVGLTRDRFLTVEHTRNGWYEWTVCVVQAEEGTIKEERSSPLSPWSFFWRPS